MSDDTTNLGPLFALLRVVLPAFFVLLAKMGILTGITPDNVHGVVSEILDWLVVVLPLAFGIWAATKATRTKLIDRTTKLPGVLAVAVTPELDAKIKNPVVVTPEKIVQAVVIDQAQRGP